MKSGDLIRFNRDTYCFEQGPIVPSNFTIPAGSVGIVLREMTNVSCHSSLFEVLVDGKILFEIEPGWSIETLSEGECL